MQIEIPTVAFFTSAACSAAMECAMWKAGPFDIKSDEAHLLPGLSEEMTLTLSDVKRQSRGSPPPGHDGGPPTGRGRFSLPSGQGVGGFPPFGLAASVPLPCQDVGDFPRVSKVRDYSCRRRSKGKEGTSSQVETDCVNQSS